MRRADEPKTTAPSVWTTAPRDGFTVNMMAHFEKLGPGERYHNGLSERL